MRTDILLDDDFDLIDEGTEWAEGESDEQHVQLLVILGKADIKQYPYACFGANTWLKKRILNNDQFERALRIELEGDGYPAAEIDLTNGIQDLKIII
jgi:hypothetical protein